MALIRVPSSLSLTGKTDEEVEIIVNTFSIAFITPDLSSRSTTAIIHLVGGQTISVTMPFDHLWQLIQRET